MKLDTWGTTTQLQTSQHGGGGPPTCQLDAYTAFIGNEQEFPMFVVFFSNIHWGCPSPTFLIYEESTYIYIHIHIIFTIIYHIYVHIYIYIHVLYIYLYIYHYIPIFPHRPWHSLPHELHLSLLCGGGFLLHLPPGCCYFVYHVAGWVKRSKRNKT